MPDHAHRRFAMDLNDLTEDAAEASWPDLLRLCRIKVRAERLGKSPEVAAWPWWHYWRPRQELYRAISGQSRVLVTNCGAAPHLAFAFVRPDAVYANTLAVIALDAPSDFSVVQSRVHELWARFFASSMKDDLRYTPSDCFETFPFPTNPDAVEALDRIGRRCYDYRADLMKRTDQGLTNTYNAFHSRECGDSDIVELRRLHDEMDRTVLDAYGWTDIRPTCEFILDYDDDEDTLPGKVSKKKKPWRYRWPDEIRDKVLGRLLALNAERARAEAGGSSQFGSEQTRSRKSARPKINRPLPTLFEEPT